MAIDGLSKVLLRRWYATLLGLAITVGAVATAFALVPATYTATADAVILPPPTTSANGSPNPYLELGGLEGITDVLSRTIESPAVGNRLTRSGATGSYTVGQDSTTSGSLVLVSATGDTAREALRTRDVVIDALQPTLQRLQADIDVADRYRLTVRIVTAQDKAGTVTKTRTRAAIAAAAVGLVLTLVLAAGAEALALRRRARARDTAQEEEPAPSVADVEAMLHGSTADPVSAGTGPPERD